jgi:hypothetical protein
MLSAVKLKIQSTLYREDDVENLDWMNTLQEMDSLEALRKITERLAKIQFNSNISLEKRIDLVLEIDKLTYRKVSKSTHKYLSLFKLNRNLETDLYDVAYSYQRQLYLAYTQFLDFYEGQIQIQFKIEKMNLILARHLNATFAMAKLRYFDDQPAPSGTWANVCKVIKCAENLSIVNKNIFLYPHKKKETSIASILYRGFMLNILQKGNYNRLQIQLAEQILKMWANNPVITTAYKVDKYHFFINVESDRGPERIRSVEKFADYRFWRITGLVDNVESFLCAVDTQKSQEEFGLSKMASTSVLTALFKKLRVDWCVEGYERQRRKDSRDKRNKLINVSYGLEDICRRADAFNPALDRQPTHRDVRDFELKVALYHKNRTNPKATANVLGNENWWAIDESANGIGVDLGKTYSSWIEPGKLIAYTTSDDKDVLVIAEIKSVRKQANGNYRAGLEVHGKRAKTVQINRMNKRNLTQVVSGYYVNDGDDASSVQDNSYAALLLNQEDATETNSLSLIIPRSEYKRGNRVKINLDGKDKIVEMGLPLMKQREWVRASLTF